MTPGCRKICIFGTHHAYQLGTIRRSFVEHIRSLIVLHSVDLVAEEATDAPTNVRLVAQALNLPWKNVDLTAQERIHVPDLNPHGIGTQVDCDHLSLREWIWVVRTTKAMKQSALLVCGLAHTTGVAEKFRSLGFDVEAHVYFDKRDEELFMSRKEI